MGALVIFERSAGAAAPGGGSSPIRATGRTGSDGTFELMTYVGNDGAPAGDYLVGISSVPARTEGGIFQAAPGSITKGNPDVLRGRFAEPRSSGLKAKVEERDNQLDPFDLK